MPVILTLHSGAALARSSNLVSATPVESPDASGRTLCLDTDSVYPASETQEIYDLGEPPYARVTAINERDYHRLPNKGADGVGEGTMCREGGLFYHKPAGSSWQEVNVPRGVLVSATALTSFASEIVITDL